MSTGGFSRPPQPTQPVFIKTAQDLISRMDDKCSKVFNAHQGKFGSQWLNVVPCKNLGLKLDDQQLRISIGLRLGASICVGHTCHCGKRVERDGLHGLSCTKSAGRFSRVGGNRSKERDRKSELVLRSTYQIFEWDRNNSDRNFYNVVRYVHIPLVP